MAGKDRGKGNRGQAGKAPGNKGPGNKGPGNKGAASKGRRSKDKEARKAGPERAAHDSPRRDAPRRDVPRGDSPSPASRGPRREAVGESGYWLYGRHPVTAALANPARRLERLMMAESPDPDMTRRMATLRLPLGPEVVGRATIEALLPPGAIHQGLALRVQPLPQLGLASLLDELGERPGVIVALDHVTDPQNVGAILRSAAAFGATAVLTTQDHAPPEGAVLAKAASGGLEVVPYLRETNLARALDRLKEAGFWAYGLDEAGDAPLRASEAAARSVIVLGAEGEGLRRLTRERCDRLFRLPTRPPIAALNVSNAAAVALYELLGRA